VLIGLAILSVVAVALGQIQYLPNLTPFPNSSGFLRTFNTNNNNGPIDLTGPFFQSLGANGRTCETCHQASDGWTFSARNAQQRFERTAGMDPLFRTNDGANCDHDIDTSTLRGRRQAYSLLTQRGLIRITLSVPAGAEFEVAGVSNPYACNEYSPLSLYRRTLPATNLRFNSEIMWDGRESSIETGSTPITPGNYPQSLLSNLAHQALGATNGHAQATVPLTPQQQQEIVDFEMGLTSAQATDFGAGPLDAAGATGGPVPLAAQSFFIGINDPFSPGFNPAVFSLFDAWSGFNSNTSRARILRGQILFNTMAFRISGVAGLNDMLGVPEIMGTCGVCHSTPNVGNVSLPAQMDIGLSRLAAEPLDVTYLPVITLRKLSDGETIQTTDPGRALVTGKWSDIGKFKSPNLRGLAARAPYFHNGAASTLDDVVRFYDERFTMGLTLQQRLDLVAFLSAL
jgi:hypothetical protein